MHVQQLGLAGSIVVIDWAEQDRHPRVAPCRTFMYDACCFSGVLFNGVYVVSTPSRVVCSTPKSSRCIAIMSRKSQILAFAVILANGWASLMASAAEPWSPSPVDINAPAGNAVFPTAANAQAAHLKSPSYQDRGIENALDTGDYARAQTLITNRLNNLTGGKNTFSEAYLRTALVEAVLWQGQVAAAGVELKKLKKVLENLSPGGGHSFSQDDEKELNARALDDESWYLEAMAKMDEAQTASNAAVVKLKELHAADRQTWRLVACLTHSAALKAVGGDYEGARQLLQDALTQAAGSHSISPLNVADVQESLGSILYRLGDQKDASAHFQQAIGIKNFTRAVTRRYAPGPYWLSPCYRYIEGSPWSAKTFKDGVETKVIDLGAIKVGAAIMRDKSASKQSVQVMLTVINQSGQSIEFMGKRPELVAVTPKIVFAKMIDSNAVAAQIQKKGEGKAKWIRFWGQGATQTMNTTYMGNMPFYGYGYGGAYPPVMSYGGAYPVVTRSGNMTNVMTQVPDPMAEARAFQKAGQVEETARARAEDIRSRSLGPSDIAAGQTLTGSIFFDAPGVTDKSMCQLDIPIGDSTFQFHLDNIGSAP
jgi:tetratricopeptide (TPR) repeat protein